MVRNTTVEMTFRHSFRPSGLVDDVPPGTCHIDIEEQRIDGPSLLACHRLATFIRLPLTGHGVGSSQALPVDPGELAQALGRDTRAHAMEESS